MVTDTAKRMMEFKDRCLNEPRRCGSITVKSFSKGEPMMPSISFPNLISESEAWAFQDSRLLQPLYLVFGQLQYFPAYLIGMLPEEWSWRARKRGGGR